MNNAQEAFPILYPIYRSVNGMQWMDGNTLRNVSGAIQYGVPPEMRGFAMCRCNPYMAILSSDLCMCLVMKEYWLSVANELNSPIAAVRYSPQYCPQRTRRKKNSIKHDGIICSAIAVVWRADRILERDGYDRIIELLQPEHFMSWYARTTMPHFDARRIISEPPERFPCHPAMMTFNALYQPDIMKGEYIEQVDMAVPRKYNSKSLSLEWNPPRAGVSFTPPQSHSPFMLHGRAFSKHQMTSYAEKLSMQPLETLDNISFSSEEYDITSSITDTLNDFTRDMTSPHWFNERFSLETGYRRAQIDTSDQYLYFPEARITLKNISGSNDRIVFHNMNQSCIKMTKHWLNVFGIFNMAQKWWFGTQCCGRILARETIRHAPVFIEFEVSGYNPEAPWISSNWIDAYRAACLKNSEEEDEDIQESRPCPKRPRMEPVIQDPHSFAKMSAVPSLVKLSADVHARLRPRFATQELISYIRLYDRISDRKFNTDTMEKFMTHYNIRSPLWQMVQDRLDEESHVDPYTVSINVQISKTWLFKLHELSARNFASVMHLYDDWTGYKVFKRSQLVVAYFGTIIEEFFSDYHEESSSYDEDEYGDNNYNHRVDSPPSSPFQPLSGQSSSNWPQLPVFFQALH